MTSFRLKELRKKSQISQADLASELDVSTRSIQRYESEDFEPNIKQLIRLSDMFDVSIDYLVGRTDNPTRL